MMCALCRARHVRPSGWRSGRQMSRGGLFNDGRRHLTRAALPARFARARARYVPLTRDRTESPPPAPTGMQNGVSTVADMVRAWPRAAMRLVQVTGARPGP